MDTVINYDAPTTLTSYLHRVGRTARAGSRGLAVTLAEDGDRALLKQVVKSAQVALMARAPPQHAVKSWAFRIDALEDDVSRIRAEEAEERVLRKAEMEATKAANMIEHEADIKARPPRTWFQTEAKKRALAEASRQEALGPLPEGVEQADGQAKEDGKQGRRCKEEARAKRKREAQEAAAAEKKHKGDPLTEVGCILARGICTSSTQQGVCVVPTGDVGAQQGNPQCQGTGAVAAPTGAAAG